MPDTKLDRENRIRERAYKLWEQHGRPHGRDADIWQQAEDVIGMEDNPAQGKYPFPARVPRRLRSRRITARPRATEATALKHHVRETGRKPKASRTSVLRRGFECLSVVRLEFANGLDQRADTHWFGNEPFMRIEGYLRGEQCRHIDDGEQRTALSYCPSELQALHVFTAAIDSCDHDLGHFRLAGP